MSASVFPCVLAGESPLVLCVNLRSVCQADDSLAALNGVADRISVAAAADGDEHFAGFGAVGSMS
ncbi:MAG: hypothetical protein IT195_09115 [Microthrixaceae bacterium]|nr:hypothetical protein [Microthrixaceae bacterium]